MVIGVVGDTGTLTSYRSLIMEANKTITLNATGGVINCNTFQGTSVSSAISLFTNTTGNAIYIGNTSNGNGIVMNQIVVMQAGKDIIITATGSLHAETIRGATLSNPVSLYLAQTGAISFGNNLGTGGGITFNDNITLPANRTITLNATGGVINCNTFQGTSASSAISLFQNTTGNSIIIGNISNGNAINPQMTIAMASGKNITITATGNLQVETIRGATLSNPVSLYLAQTGVISFGNNLGTGGGITFNDNITLPANRTITLNATGGKILCNVYTGITASSDITLGESTDTGNLLIYKTINTNINLGTGISIQFTSTGQMSINTIRGVLFANTISLYLDQTGPINLGNTASTNPLTINTNTTLASGKNLTLSTSGKILCNVYTGIATSSNLTIGESGNTGNLDIFKTITSSNTYSGNNTYSGGNTHSGSNTFSGALNTFNNDINLAGRTASKILLTNGSKNIVSSAYNDTDFVLKSGSSMTGTLNVNDIQGTTTSSAITLFTLSSVSSPTITLGNASGGTFTINPNTQLNGNLTLPANKTLTLNTTGGKILCNVYTGTATSSNLTLGESGNTGNLQIFKTITSSNTYSGTNTYSGGNTHSGSNTFSGATNTFNNELKVNTITGTTISSAISLYALHTSTISLGYSGVSGNFTINPNTVIATGKNLTLSTTGKIIVNTIDAISTTADLSLGTNLTGLGNVVLHTKSSTGNIVANRPIRIEGAYNTANTLRPALQFYQLLTSTTFEESFLGHILGNGIPYGQYAGVNLPTVAGWVLSNDKYFCMSTYVGGSITNEASSFLLSANTVLNVSPGDFDSMIYIDEDIPGGAGTWTGYRISVAGAIVASSDRRIKRAIVNHDDTNILDKIEQLQVIDYKLKRPDGITRATADQKYNRIHTGYIAQDMRQVFPELVEKNDDDFGMLSIDYTKLNYKFQIAVQRLITQNKQQQAQIDDLTTRLARLEQLILNP
jgi:hypothetical protein